MELIGEAQRAGDQTPTRIAQFVVAAKGIDQGDKKLVARMIFNVKDCRKRMNARGI
jgi:hypothetical protein